MLADDTDDLYESIHDLRQTPGAVVDLRLNVSSLQMNRVMRVLALLTALALFPATAGGLLGMKLMGSPWSATLGQVSFGVAGAAVLGTRRRCRGSARAAGAGPLDDGSGLSHG